MEIHPVTPDRLDDLADLFVTGPATRNCWCMWFIDSSKAVQAGWNNGGNRKAFEALRVGYRRSGVTAALVAAAVEAARAHGAHAVEGFPIADAYPKSQDDYVGKQRRFAECGFRCVAEPSPRRVVMRRDLH